MDQEHLGMKNKFKQNHQAIGRRDFLKYTVSGSVIAILPATMAFSATGNAVLSQDRKTIPTATGEFYRNRWESPAFTSIFSLLRARATG
ncbi:MAG: hypothetical protein U5K79_01880 [Cyclobacteriaceae bacterium]|nr:hypothetical protein [Cyclobacteriaceae bacterium]